jgi:p-hydroxybenzoate 3-monooxygenase
MAGCSSRVMPRTAYPRAAVKGLNPAIADVRALPRALAGHYLDGHADLLDACSASSLQRAWRAQRFLAWMTTLLHREPGAADFALRLPQEGLEQLMGSGAAATVLAENHVDLSRA